MHNSINGRDVVVAIIGGTLLALALTRPKLDWVERLEDESRQIAEILTTAIAFAIGGYAYGSLYIVLHRQLGGDIDKLLRGAGVIFALYAACVHFEPFSTGRGWREHASAIFLYITVAIAATLIGVVFVEYTLTHSVSGWSTLIKAMLLLLVAFFTYVFAHRPIEEPNKQKVDDIQVDPLPASNDAGQPT